MSSNKIDAVFEGGGVKGAALVGAVVATENAGFTFENLAGTSAGAIVASLLAAGYRGSEIKTLMDGLDLKLLKDPTMLSRVPLVGIPLSLLFTQGIYKGDYLENWLRMLFKAKNVSTFGDLVIPEYADDPKFRYKLQVIASDITNGKLLILPRDAADYGVPPDDLDLAHAVRMSMSIPYFYTPIVWENSNAYIVDGGILSNFPVWILDDASANPPWPTIGYKLVDPNEGKPHSIKGPVSLFAALFETMMEAHDARYIENKDFMRTVPIPTLGVQTTDFFINQTTKNALYNAGFKAATAFFSTWNFEDYKAKFRADISVHRTDRLWK